jgi:hypothetical protein
MSFLPATQKYYEESLTNRITDSGTKNIKKLTSRVTKQPVRYVWAVHVVLLSFRITDTEFLRRALESTANSLEGTNKHFNIILHVFNKK